MADELEPVEQKFVANLADYVEPIKNAADETEGFAGVVRETSDSLKSMRDEAAETGGSLDDLGDQEDDAAFSAKGLEEAQHELRDSLAETDHELHDQTESFFAQSYAADQAALSLEANKHAGDNLSQSLETLKGELLDFIGPMTDVGSTFSVTKLAADRFAIGMYDSAEEAKKLNEPLSADKIAMDFLGDAMSRAQGKALEATAAADKLGVSIEKSGNIAKDARKALLALGFSEYEAAAGAKALESAQRDLNNLIGIGAGAGGGGGGFWSKILGGIAGPAADPGSLVAFSFGALAVAPAIIAIVQEVGLLITGFIAAADAVGSFAIFAIPTLEKVFKAIHDNKTELGKLPAAEQEAVRGLRGLAGEYDDLARAFRPEVLTAFNLALKGAGELLPALQPLAQAASTALDPLLRKLDQFLDPTQIVGWRNNKPILEPSQFAQWMTSLSKISGPALTAIGQGLGNVATNFGKLMTALPPKDAADAISIFFRIISGSLRGIAWIAVRVAHNWEEFKSGMVRTWDDLRTGWDKFSHTMEGGADQIGHAADDVRHAFDRMNDDIDGVIRDVQTTVARWKLESDISSLMVRVAADWDTGWSKVVTFTEGIPGKIEHALGDLGSLLFHGGAELISGLISGIESRIPGLESIVHTISGIVGDIEGLFHSASSASAGAANVSGAATAHSASVNHSVTVHVAAMSSPAYQAGVARVVHAAVLGFASQNSGSMLLLPGRRN